MKHLRVIFGLILFLFCFMSSAFSETIDVPSKITAVTVFADRAMVTRQATVTLPQGAHAIRIAPLPASVEEDSVTAKGLGEAKVKIFGATLSRKELTLPQDEKVRLLQEQIQQLQDKEKGFRDTLNMLQQEREFLASVRAASSEQLGKDIVTKQPDAKGVADLLRFLGDSFRANVASAQSIEIELRELRKEMDRLQREMSQLGQGGYKQELAILIEVESEKSGKFELEVSYRLPGATWSTRYEARTDGVNDVEWTTYGMIRQWTGEEWKDVSLTLSTARPSLGARMSELVPWFLRQWTPPPYQMASTVAAKAPMGGMAGAKERKAFNRGKEMLDADEMGGIGGSEEEKAELAEATVETAGPTVVYHLPKKESMPSGSEWRKVPITSQKLPSQFAYEATPKLTPFAYLRAKVKNKTESFYLAGPVQVFLQGAFVGTSSIKAIAPEEEFDLFLGVDERIKVERKQLKEKVDVSILPGLHGKTKTIDHEILITVQNFTSKKATVWVQDQIPVSQHDEIKIEAVTLEPKPMEPAEEDKMKPGLQRWQLTLAPQQKGTIKISFRIRHPVEMQVEGL